MSASAAMNVFLVPAPRGRYELYSEPPDGEDAGPPPTGRIRGWIHRASVQWHALVAQARQGGAADRIGRWRDRVVCALAESIAEQRTLWALRHQTTATVHMPATLSSDDARDLLCRDLGNARRHHLRWLIIDTVLFVISGVLAVVPGPNLIAYYFAFRCIGHLQSWRGAKQGSEHVTWTFLHDAALTELQELVNLPRSTRAPRVEAIAARLHLRHLADFFDRIAVPSA